MAIVAEKKELQEVAEILAQSRKLFKDHVALTDLLTKQAAALKEFDTKLVMLINSEESLSRATKNAEANLAKTEQAAKTRLMTIEQGHKTLIDSLSRQKIELDNKMADLEKRERNAAAMEQKYTLLVEQKEREVAAVKTLRK